MVASQSVVGRANAEKAHGIVGLLKNPFVFLTCCFASLGCIMYGYDQGVMGPILVMENFQNHFPTFTGSTIQGWLVSALELGAWAGALINGILADRISRKYAMMSAVLIFTLGTGLQAGAQTPAYFFAGRVIGGVGIGMFSMVIPLYQAEIAPPELRGSLVSLQQLSITIGTAISFWLDYGMQYVGGTTCNPEGISNPYLTDGTYNAALTHGHTCLGQKTIAWRLPLALQIIPAWILFFGMFWFPFSPRWLMMKHRDEDALASLSKLRRLPATNPLVRAEFLEIKAAVMFDEETESEAIGAGGTLAPWKALFAPNMLKRLFLGCGTMICQQFTGINAVLYYAPQIFASFGFSSTKQTLLATGVTGILQIIFTLPAVLFLDKFGRKTFLIVGAIGMFLCHIVVATVEGIYKPKWDLNQGLDKGQGWVAIVFIWLFAVNFAYSWGMHGPLFNLSYFLANLPILGPVAWVLTQEIFPNSQRSKGVAIVASTNWLFNFIIGLTTKDMLNSMKYGTYIFFAIFSGLGGLFIWWFAPETKDKTLEELDVFFGGSEASIAEADRQRMQRINESLGLAGVENVEDLKVAVTSEQVEM
ncbi:Major facilitator superfamily domain general substrate transporter [Penicillium maclennaniae]|uniref:Major facilitator superfamily domain general substrate transporter n=1 Tax=Penicillium maclennaniae TaxID=1343394 RepID=UPI002540D393|nr:Major facilitator superfamily domain general substrate transporter [Penicillium maclennaniae]KAJ5682104.1 Major facilitator superfamily domain general substrate transporter [Penicillium maclennaniae]